MKIFFLLSIQLLALSGSVFSQQCPPSALKIQSPVCDTPRNLRVNDISCTTVKLNWKGNKEQSYVVEATCTDAAANTIFETKAAAYSCDENGNCAATISVKEGAKVDWNVQSICNINGVTIYSPKIEGKRVLVPYCRPIAQTEGNNNTEISKTTMHVYPNPSNGYLTVEYYSKGAGAVKLSIVDMNGKIVFDQFRNAGAGKNSYTLDLQRLLPGSYVLELNNYKEISRVKFILLGH